MKSASHGGSPGVASVVRNIVRDEGVRALFRGTGLTLLRDVPGSFFYFMVYEAVKRSFGADRDKEVHAGVVLLSGGKRFLYSHIIVTTY